MEPAGLGTGEIEALSSYLCRHADEAMELAHPYTERLLTRFLPSDELPACRKLPAIGLSTCNGTGIMARRHIEAINRASDGKIDAQYLTLKPLSYLSDNNSRGLQKRYLAWCPDCWTQDMSSGLTPYVRLYWLFQHTKICTLHSRRLSEYCPACGDVKFQFPKFPRQWLCDKCGTDLRKNDAKHQSENFTSEDAWVSHALFRLVEHVYSNRLEITASHVPNAVTRLLKTAALSADGLANRLNISSTMLSKLISGERRVFFPALLDFCYRLDVPPHIFLFDRDILTNADMWRCIPKPTFVASSRVPERKRNAILRDLTKILRENPNPPARVSHIARKHGISYSAMFFSFPREYQELRKRWLAWEAQERQGRHTQRLQKLCYGIFNLAKHGVYPSDRKLRDLGFVLPSDLRRDDIKSVLRTLQDIYSDFDEQRD